MTIAQLAILVAANVLLLAALAGLVARRRLRLAYCFPVYLLVVVVLSSLPAFWQSRFNTWSFYWFKQTVYTALELAVALELTVRAFQAFPAARRTAHAALLLVVIVTVIAAWTAPMPSASEVLQREWADRVLALLPRFANGAAWLFGALFALILYYRIPLHPLHKAIAFGFMAFLLLLTVGLDQVKRSDFARLTLVSYAGSIGYTMVAAYWARVAWRRDPPPPVAREVVDRLQPWRRDGPSPDL
jgi:cytochrome b561